MLALHGAAQGLDSIRVLIVVIVVLCVIFARIMLHILLIVVGSLLLIGAVTFLQDLLHIVK
jgi:hypothetical protein